jgi:hypothetical protein
MANDGATNTARNHQPARPDVPATLPNRNKTSFKIPRNALKINLEPNPNRNKNSVRRFWRAGSRRSRNKRFSRVAGQGSRITIHKSRIAPYRPRITTRRNVALPTIRSPSSAAARPAFPPSPGRVP